MKELLKDQQASLKALGKRLNDRKVAAKYYDKDKLLTVLLPVKAGEGDLFTDIMFLPEDERMEDVSFCSLRTVVADLSDTAEDKILKLCRDVCIVNNELAIGCYGVQTTDGKLPLKALVFSVTVPIVPEIKGERMTDTIEDALSLTAVSIKETASRIVG